ncbi:MAG: DegT/DnrJ/EryC1/StrS family aminotransferase [Chitinophagaceae bacterium]
MRPIQMVDLKQQYLKIKDEVDAGIKDVIENTSFIGGKQVQEFSTNLGGYLSVPYVIPCANGTDALQIAMMALDLQPGDEVITPSFTYVATTEVIALLKLKPVFVEVDPQTFCIDPAAIKAAITPRTKAIVPVHLYGQSAPMQEILQIAKEHGLYIIEDNAQAIGTEYRFDDGTSFKTGTMGTIGTTSFFPSKNLGCFGDGGAIFTRDEALANRMRMIANHGQSRRYYHDMVGCNSRLDALQAAVLNVKLPKLDEYIAARQKAAAFYNAAFAGHPHIRTPYQAAYSSHVFHQYTIVLDQLENPAEVRNALNQYLAENQVPSMIYYPVPAHKQKMFAAFGGEAYNLPVTDWLTERVISLPMHTELDEQQLKWITDHVINFLNKQ